MFDRIREVAGQVYQDYLSAGYREWTSPTWAESKKTPYFMQKAIYRDNVRLFFINLTWYDWTIFGSEQRPEMPNFGVEADVQFNCQNGETFNIQFLDTIIKTPEQIEKFFMKVFSSMDCVPYDND